MSDSVATLLDKGVRLHRAGQFAEALTCYDRVLLNEPSNPDALNLKGVIAIAAGQHSDAEALFKRAIGARPNFPEAVFNRALAFAAMGRNTEALQSYQQAIGLRSAYADARVNAGLLLFAMKKHDDAIAAFRAMTEACPSDARGFYNLGVCLEKSLEHAPAHSRADIAAAAEGALDRATALDRTNPDVHFARGNLHMRMSEHKMAAARFETALTLRPDWPNALSGLAAAQMHLDDLERAIHAARRAVQCDPNHAHARGTLAEILLRAGEIEEALPHFEAGLKGAPDNAAMLSNYGLALTRAGRVAEAAVAYEHATANRPGDAEARYALGLALLALGRLEEGWRHYESRHALGEGRLGLRARERSPLPPPGAKLIAVNEQGLGEQLMFTSFIPDLLKRTADLEVHCDGRLIKLFERSFPTVTFAPRALNSAPAGLRAVSLADCGQWLRPDFTHFPRRAGHLRASPERTAELRAQYRAGSSNLVVGISWATRASAKLGEAKSIPLQDWEPILSMPGVTFVSLQYDANAAEIAETAKACGARIISDDGVDPATDLDGFAAQVAAVDLVITTSNTTAHMGGALNTPTWVMVPHGIGSLWHWFLDRDDSPWYPSVRLFRQTNRGDWRPVLKTVAAVLADKLRARSLAS